MAREHGKAGRVMMSASSTTVPVTVVLSEWTLNMATDQVEVTSFGDANKTYVQGLKDLQGTISGFWESASDQLFIAADSSTGTLMYLYPDVTNHPVAYWYGLANMSASISVSATGANSISGTFSARGAWTRAWVTS